MHVGPLHIVDSLSAMQTEQLQARLHAALAGCSASSPDNALWLKVKQAYTQPHRHYHNLQHLDEMLRWLDAACSMSDEAKQASDSDTQLQHEPPMHQSPGGRGIFTVELAVFLHDLVYDPLRHDNEQASAVQSRELLEACGCPEQVVGDVERLVLATEKHLLPSGFMQLDSTADAQVLGDGPAPGGTICTGAVDRTAAELFLDADLSILAAPARRYHEYAAAIRQEYSHLPDDTFRAGRTEVLKRLLDRPTLFFSTWAHNLGMEQRARTNLEAEVQLLVCGAVVKLECGSTSIDPSLPEGATPCIAMLPKLGWGVGSLLLQLWLAHWAGCSAEPFVVTTGAQVAKALLLPAPPDVVLLAANVQLRAEDWPTGVSTTLYHHITIQGAVPNSTSKTYPVLDWNWITRLLGLAPGVQLTLRGLVLKGFRRTLDDEFSFLSFSPQGHLELSDVIMLLPAGIPNAIRVPGIRATQLPTGWPHGSEQQVQEWPGCYPWSDADGSFFCFNESLRYVETATSVAASASVLWGMGGYIAHIINSTVTQPVVMSADCMDSLTPAGCYQAIVDGTAQHPLPQVPLAPTASPAPAAEKSISESGLNNSMPAAITGAAVLTAAVISSLWFFRKKFRTVPPSLRKFMAPVAGCDTSLVITDIQGSTSMWETLPSAVMDSALKLHHACIRELLTKYQGTESATEGDSFILCFHTADAAIAFCLEVQDQLMQLDWPKSLLSHQLARPLWAVPRQGHATPLATPVVREDDRVDVTVDVGDGSFKPPLEDRLLRTGSFRQWRGSATAPSRRASHRQLPLEATTVTTNSVHGGPNKLHSCSWLQHLASQWQLTEQPESFMLHEDFPACELLIEDCALVLHGMRVRMGVHAGVSASDIVQNTVSGRTQYTGAALMRAKAVCDMAQGGMVLLSAEAFKQATAGPALADAAIVHLGEYISDALDHVDTAQPLYTAVRPSLLTRLVAIPGPSKQLQVSAGTLDAPVGSVTIAFNYIVGFSSLQSWSHDLAVSAADMFAALATEKLRLRNGYLVEMDRGFCLAAFASPLDAILWSHDCKDGMIVLPWPAALLEHALCEEVMDDDTASVLMRGPRIKVGIDTATEVCTETSPATGRMTYRGKVMNRAARVASKATSGKIFASADCWRALSASAQALINARSQGIMDLKGVGKMEVFCITLSDGEDVAGASTEHLGLLESMYSQAPGPWSGAVHSSLPPSVPHTRSSDSSRRSGWSSGPLLRRRSQTRRSSFMMSVASISTQTELTWPQGSASPELVARDGGDVRTFSRHSASLGRWGTQEALVASPAAALAAARLQEAAPDDDSSVHSSNLHVIIS